MNTVQKNIVRILISLAFGFLLVKAILEFCQVALGLDQGLESFPSRWSIAFLAFVVFCILIFLLIICLLWFPARTEKVLSHLIQARNRLGILRWFIVVAAVVVPSFLFLYTEWGAFFTTPFLRLLAFLLCSIIFAFFISREETKLVDWNSFLLASVISASIFLVAQYLTKVTTYPFALSWSEGNRLYDYSLYIDPNRYLFADEMKTPYKSPGRYMLWGILYLIPGTPIWLHRLWDAFLWCVPCLVFGLLLSRWSNLAPKDKLLYTLWIFLFLSQGPIYPPLILSAILVVLFVRSERWFVSLIGASVASYYASVSRWTWWPAVPAWSTLILLADLKFDTNSKWTRNIRGLIPIAAIGLVSLGIGSLANLFLFSPKKLSANMAFAQPLLWNRLLPNSTYTYGILAGIIIAVSPLAILLIWMVFSKRWRLHWLQILAGCAACLVFLAMGLVASVKIGSGSNLHNLDMFLITLAILSGLMLRQTGLTSPGLWPRFAQIILVLMVLLPCWDVFRAGSPLVMPTQQETTQALGTLQQKISKAEKQGLVLLIDERQLVTFGYIEDLPLVSDYEKKYLMDQAMAGNASYFSNFYEDLKEKRFAMIITEPLFTIEQDASRAFSEENNAWVKWVAKPLMCYYAPTGMIEEVKLQFLVPRLEPENCP